MPRVNPGRAGTARAREYLAAGCAPGADAVTGSRAAAMLAACTVALVGPAILLAGQTLNSEELTGPAGVEFAAGTRP